ncbi:MAG: carbohydrate-binding family 9-like protein [Pyrinomonadaceae bacterium]
MIGELSSEIEAPWTSSDLPASDLESPEWQLARSIAITHDWAGKPAARERHAEVRILWSNAALHIRFIGNQLEPPIVSANPQLETKTIGLWERDVCEIFIAPDANKPEKYFEFEAAPTGEWLDLAVQWNPKRRETDWEFDSGMTVGTRIDKDRVVIAMRIPWSDSIPKPGEGERWRVNLFRCVGTGWDRYLAWRPTRTEEPNFHVPESFGWLVFTR